MDMVWEGCPTYNKPFLSSTPAPQPLLPQLLVCVVCQAHTTGPHYISFLCHLPAVHTRQLWPQVRQAVK